MEDTKNTMTTLRKVEKDSGMLKGIHKNIMHNCNNKMYEDGIIGKQLYLKVRAEIDRL